MRPFTSKRYLVALQARPVGAALHRTLEDRVDPSHGADALLDQGHDPAQGQHGEGEGGDHDVELQELAEAHRAGDHLPPADEDHGQLGQGEDEDERGPEELLDLHGGHVAREEVLVQRGEPLLLLRLHGVQLHRGDARHHLPHPAVDRARGLLDALEERLQPGQHDEDRTITLP